MEKKVILENLKKFGVFKTHVSSFKSENIFNFYKKNKLFLEKVICEDEVVDRKELLRKGRPIKDRTKFYEFQSKQLIGEGLSLDNSPIINFYLQDLFLDIAEDYLETKQIRMRNCMAYYHPKNPFPPTNSQNWHRDTEDKKILKVFVYYNDVTQDNGALSYVKNSKFGSKNNDIWSNLNDSDYKHGYLSLKAISKIPFEDITTLEGQAGTICFFDANGFHKGGQVRTGERLATHCCYLRSDAPHIKNKILPTFDYNHDVNFLNKKSENYLKLSERQKKLLQ